ncbi:type II toxin-antitoxin system RatA family toxin [Congregibacter litoralis]|uniref:Oligoketide cyclase/lipid transport protein n=1 Tax=Congregibacter litoralis KT71 TaxID=314285 RepID=A4A5S1_9GAMM|nr:type II toxin-antitoxin system RatA family toxin [Congregibacter litoralis]EAQ98368.2 Oligoketide cyclase/lipid transport protein [Congregibacter litoralis KT71]
MTSIHRSALLPLSDQQLFALVNDVEAYPQYMDGCVGASILRTDAEHMEARLDLARGGISHSFTTRNELLPYKEIRLTLKDGPFEEFSGAWRFHALAEEACKVSLDLEFRFRGGLLSAAAAKLFDRVTGNLVDAVVRRAQDVYGV